MKNLYADMRARLWYWLDCPPLTGRRFPVARALIPRLAVMTVEATVWLAVASAVVVGAVLILLLQLAGNAADRPTMGPRR